MLCGRFSQGKPSGGPWVAAARRSARSLTGAFTGPYAPTSDCPRVAANFARSRQPPRRAGHAKPTEAIRAATVRRGRGVEAIGSGRQLGHSLGSNPNPVGPVLTMGERVYSLSFGGD